MIDRAGTILITEHVNVRHAVHGIAERLAAAGRPVTLVPSGTAAADLPDCDVLMTSSAFACTAAVMDRLPRLRGIAAVAAGTESIDIAAATERGIVVAHAPTAENIVSMAEATIMLILVSLYRLHDAEAMLKAGWQRPAEPHARTLSGKTVGLIGFGRIARAVAARLAGWGVEILVWSPNAPPESIPPDVRQVELDALLSSADIVSLHASLGPRNKHLVGATFLAKLKPGAVLVNTARGGLVDEAALLQAAHAETPPFVVLDCFGSEPLPADSPLRQLPGAILTPHIVGHTREAQESLVRQGVRNIDDILSGAVPEFIRNPEVIDRWSSRFST